jgi:hypothetical protein
MNFTSNQKHFALLRQRHTIFLRRKAAEERREAETAEAAVAKLYPKCASCGRHHPPTVNHPVVALLRQLGAEVEIGDLDESQSIKPEKLQ